jgi:hypothetical protein
VYVSLSPVVRALVERAWVASTTFEHQAWDSFLPVHQSKEEGILWVHGSAMNTDCDLLQLNSSSFQEAHCRARYCWR